MKHFTIKIFSLLSLEKKFKFIQRILTSKSMSYTKKIREYLIHKFGL